MDVAAHAHVVADFLTDLSLDHPVLVGHSMGTQVVAQLAADRPELVDHIVLIAPVLQPAARGVPAAALLLARNGLREPLPVTAMAFYDYLVRSGVVYMVRQTPHLIGMHIEDFLPRISAKTLVICGRNDPIVPLGWGRQLAEMCPHGWFATVPGPHAAMFAAPKIIASHLEEHARR